VIVIAIVINLTLQFFVDFTGNIMIDLLIVYIGNSEFEDDRDTILQTKLIESESSDSI
jgi:hypothetical protein